ncbi:MAG: sigma-70 family RNA polymerase sigma factor, partial [Phycisphaerales bacterium]
VYDELRAVAEVQLTGADARRTLEPTALVQEAYIRLLGQRTLRWQDRSQFIAVAARAMRQILVFHAISRRNAGRAHTDHRVALDEAVALFEARSIDLIALDEALTRLEEVDALQARIVELRFFGGLGDKEIAQVCGVPRRDVSREWTMARAWLRRELRPESASGDAQANPPPESVAG